MHNTFPKQYCALTDEKTVSVSKPPSRDGWGLFLDK